MTKQLSAFPLLPRILFSSLLKTLDKELCTLKKWSTPHLEVPLNSYKFVFHYVHVNPRHSTTEWLHILLKIILFIFMFFKKLYNRKGK